MLRFAADENFNNDIVRGLLRRNPEIDIQTIQDAGLSGVDDPEALEWAARENRIMLTHDITTMIQFAYERVLSGSAMPGVFEVSSSAPIGKAIEDILLLAECSWDGEWEGQIRYLPLQ